MQQLATLPEELIQEALDFICFIKHRLQPKIPTTTSETIGSNWWDNLDRFTLEKKPGFSAKAGGVR